MFTTGMAMLHDWEEPEKKQIQDTFRIQRDNGAYLWGFFFGIPMWVNDIHQAKQFHNMADAERAEDYLAHFKIYVWVLKDPEP